MEDEIDLKKEVIELGTKTGFRPDLLEKDYHLTQILKKISERKIEHLVFKGGTCLNKCYLGFYRLSEDLDFVFNQNVKGLSKPQVKKILDHLRRIIFEVLSELGLETSKELGKGWKMLTSKEEPKIVGLEIITNYKSVLNESIQKIKLEISFRRKLINPTQIRPIHHEFINELGEPLLEEDLKIEAIDLTENFAEKIRALVTRKNIATRDIYDLHYILNKEVVKLDEEVIDLALLKIKESKGAEYTKEDLRKFIENLDNNTLSLDKKELATVLKSSENPDLKEMVIFIRKSLLSEL